MITRLKRIVGDLHGDQRGAEALQILMLIAIAAVCLILVKVWGAWYFEYSRKAVEILVEN